MTSHAHGLTLLCHAVQEETMKRMLEEMRRMRSEIERLVEQ